MIIVRAPFRVSFFGGGTDFPEWYVHNGGLILSAAIDKYCYLTVRQRHVFQKPRYRLMYSKVEDVDYLDQIQHPTTREILRFMDVSHGLEIHHDADLPARSGLGSSSAFTVALLKALDPIRFMDPITLAKVAFHIERECVQEFGGTQDSIASACGGFNLYTLTRHDVRCTPIDGNGAEEIQDWMMLAYPNIDRDGTSTDVQSNMNFGKHLHHMNECTLAAHDYLKRREFHAFGELMNYAWDLKKKTNPKATLPAINNLYANMKAVGVLGGKVCGAGAGGFMVLIAPPNRHQFIREHLPEVHFVDCSFTYKGAEVIFRDEQT